MISAVNSLYDVGSREINQDSVLIEHDENMGVFAIADGMGGHSDGEKASGLIVSELKDWWINKKDEYSTTSIKQITADCIDKIILINDLVIEDFKSRNVFGGSTLVILIVKDDSYSILNVGDSRAYRQKGDILQLLTLDDVWENLGSTRENYTTQEIFENPLRGKLAMAVGCSSEDFYVHYLFRIIEKDEQILLCSDGVYKCCDIKKIKEILSDEKIFKNSDNSKLKKLEKIILEHGAPDNYSAILCKLK